ncbi:LysE family translocator [Corynebacterium camporealensis]
MTLAALFTLMGVWAAVIVTPGPDVVQIIRVSPRGKAAGLLCAVGIVVGIVFWLCASLAGLSALIAVRPGLLGALQIIGGAFLFWMGTQSLRGGVQVLRNRHEAQRVEDYTDEVTDAGDIEGMTNGRAFHLGLLTNLSNPKALVFFGAVFAQFIRPEMSIAWAVAVAVILSLMSLLWFSTLALVVRAAARWFAKYSAHLDVLAGIIFVGFGAFMVYEGAITVF